VNALSTISLTPRRVRSALRLAACIAAAGLALSATSVMAKPAPAAAGRSFAEASQPVLTGHPDSTQFVKRIEARLDRARAAVARLKAVQGPRTIDNTLAPYDEALNEIDVAGSEAQLLENVFPEASMRGAGESMGQEVSAYGTELSLDKDVFAALKAMDVSTADAETQFYTQRELRDYHLAGVDKDDATRARIKTLSDEMVKTGQEFSRNIREDVRSIQVDPADLAGLPQDFIDGHKPGADGKVKLDINYPDYIPVITYCKNDDVRKRLYIEYNNRAYPKNMDVLKRMITGRNEMAHLVDYPTWADYTTATKMTGNAKVVRDFIDKIVAVSDVAQKRDYQTLLARKQKDFPGATEVAFWENAYWQELVKRSDYDFDSQALRPYLPYDRVEKGVLDVTSRMFGITFKPVKNVPVWDPSVACYEIVDHGKTLGRFYLDMHPRKDKYNHAAHFPIRPGIAGRQLPEAALICNLPGGKPGDPGLCDISDVTTFFHEFGHLLHNMFASQHRWAGISGIRTERDFVEAPSQMLEEWMRDPKTLQTFAMHYQTGVPVPAELIEKMRRADEFAKGLTVRRQMVYADLSLSIYDKDPAQVDIDALAQDLVKRYQPFAYVEGTHFPCAFGHLDGYSAVYYTYMWSLVIAKDLFSAFPADNLLDPVVAQRYRATVLAPGGSKPAAKLVEDFLGRPFGFEAYQRWLDKVN
jgi:thimet oligopeptidase